MTAQYDRLECDRIGNMRAYRYMADVSSNNGPIDVANYSRAGHAVIAIKATQGLAYVNPFHLQQTNQAHDFGLTVVHYHYCDSSSIQGQIHNFRHQYSKCWRNGDYPCFDVEVNGLGTPFTNRLLKTYHELTGREPVLYTYRSFFEEQLKGVVVPGKRTWIADYSSNPVHLPSNYILWARQYTDGKEGPEPKYYSGIGNCDGSVVSAGPALALNIRKYKTRRQK